MSKDIGSKASSAHMVPLAATAERGIVERGLLEPRFWEVASPGVPSWNQMVSWIKEMASLQVLMEKRLAG